MKARRVKELDPAGTLADNAERIVRVRLDELYSFVPRALDPKRKRRLHDMRIAAKRLRYVLEVTAPCFGPDARRAIKRMRELQDLLGDIHDCDETLPRIEAELEHARAADARALVGRAGDVEGLEPALNVVAPGRDAYRGLEMLAAHTRARRELLFARFLSEWEEIERNDFRGRLERALDRRPEPTPAPAARDGAGEARAGAPTPAQARMRHTT